MLEIHPSSDSGMHHNVQVPSPGVRIRALCNTELQVLAESGPPPKGLLRSPEASEAHSYWVISEVENPSIRVVAERFLILQNTPLDGHVAVVAPSPEVGNWVFSPEEFLVLARLVVPDVEFVLPSADQTRLLGFIDSLLDLLNIQDELEFYESPGRGPFRNPHYRFLVEALNQVRASLCELSGLNADQVHLASRLAKSGGFEWGTDLIETRRLIETVRAVTEEHTRDLRGVNSTPS